MKLLSIIASLILPTLTFAVTVSYDTAYDNGATSLTSVACSDGPNGLITAGFSTFGSLPNFPNIGGAAAVEGWNSVNCGTCWSLTYTNSKGVSKTINVLAVDHTASGFNIAMSAMNELTDNQAAFLGRVDVTSVQVDPSACGL